jgi:hypothetical protein
MSVSVESHKGRYRFRFTYQGKQRSISPGILSDGTKANEATAIALSRKLEQDLLYGTFDLDSLNPYRDQNRPGQNLSYH